MALTDASDKIRFTPDIESRFTAPRSYHSSFVGREKELSEIKQLLQTSQLITITGSGGCGKTRLAAEVAANSSGDFTQGVAYADLAAVTEPDNVWQAVAGSLGIFKSTNRETLLEIIQPYDALLILDNCEHLAEACAMLAESLFDANTDLRILATSREPLRVDGETSYRIPSLSFPAEGAGNGLAGSSILDYSAPRLFTDRASSLLWGFRVGKENEDSVAEICRKLDGIPLAIELAAAQLPAMTLEQISNRLDTELLAFSGGVRTSLPRHRRLRATMEWSYALLSEQQKCLLKRLAVFTGSWTLNAAEHICSGPPIDGTSADVFEEILGLVEKSLVQVVSRDEAARYKLLEPIRQFGLERLVDSDEERAVRRAHSAWHVDLAEKAEIHTFGGDRQLEWMQRVESEHQNFRSAIEWLQAEKDWLSVMRICKSLWWAWYNRGRYRESLEFIVPCLSADTSADSNPAYAKLAPHLYRAMTYYYLCLGDRVAGVACAYQSLEGFRKTGCEAHVGLAMARVGLAECYGFPREHAFQLVKRGVERLRDENAPQFLATALSFLCHVNRLEGDLSGETAAVEEGRELAIKCGDLFTSSNLLVVDSFIAIRNGESMEAAEKLSEARVLTRRIGNILAEAFAFLRLSQLALLNGEPKTAEEHTKQQLFIVNKLGSRKFRFAAFVDLAIIASIRQKLIRSSVLCGTALRYLQDHQSERTRDVENLKRQLNELLGPEKFSRFSATGANLPLKDIIRYALSDSNAEPRLDGEVAPLHSTPMPSLLSGLTRRETEVLTRLVEGRTNQEIALELYISEHTVANHLQNTYRKIGCNNRTEAARFAARAGLAAL